MVTYSGYTFEELTEMGQKDSSIARLLACTDILVDGPYRHEERDLSWLSADQKSADNRCAKELKRGSGYCPGVITVF